MKYIVLGVSGWIAFVSFLIYNDHQEWKKITEPYTLHRWCQVVETTDKIAFLECDGDIRMVRFK